MKNNKEIMSWLKNTWTKHRDNWITIAEMWGRRILLEWWPPVKRNGKTTVDILQMGKKRISDDWNYWEDNMKLEPRIFERTGKIWRKNSSSFFKWRRKTPTKLLRYSGRMKRVRVEPKMKRIWKRSWRWHLTDEIHSYIKLQKGFENNSGGIKRVR